MMILKDSQLEQSDAFNYAVKLIINNKGMLN